MPKKLKDIPVDLMRFLARNLQDYPEEEFIFECRSSIGLVEHLVREGYYVSPQLLEGIKMLKAVSDALAALDSEEKAAAAAQKRTQRELDESADKLLAAHAKVDRSRGH